MTTPTAPPGWPGPPGLDREEPEIAQEDDIPMDEPSADREDPADSPGHGDDPAGREAALAAQPVPG